jgi:hypothetical protein
MHYAERVPNPSLDPFKLAAQLKKLRFLRTAICTMRALQIPQMRGSAEKATLPFHRAEGDLGIYAGVGPLRTEGRGPNLAPTFSHPGLQSRVDFGFLNKAAQNPSPWGS